MTSRTRAIPSSLVPAVTRRAQARLGIALAAPLTVLMVMFLIVPLANSLYYSVVDFDGLNPNPPFVGLDNFTRMLTDPEVWAALGRNVTWIVAGTAAPLVLGLGLALLLSRVGPSAALYRMVFFFPYVLPAIAIGIVWGWIYDPLNGWLNRTLGAFGLGEVTTGWLGDPTTALGAVLATAIWSYTGFVMVIMLSALRSIDQELIDASRLDGANQLQTVLNVILPQIMPVFLMVTTITLVGGFSVFDIVFIMTGGGPNNATNVLGTYAYQMAFNRYQISYGTTIALLITALSLPIAVALNRLQRRLSIQGMGA